MGEESVISTGDVTRWVGTDEVGTWTEGPGTEPHPSGVSVTPPTKGTGPRSSG